MKDIKDFLTENKSSAKFEKTDTKGVFDFLKSLGYEVENVIDAVSPLWVKLYKMKKDEDLIQVWVNCKLRTQDETSIDKITNQHGVPVIKIRGKYLTFLDQFVSK